MFVCLIVFYIFLFCLPFLFIKKKKTPNGSAFNFRKRDVAGKGNHVRTLARDEAQAASQKTKLTPNMVTAQTYHTGSLFFLGFNDIGECAGKELLFADLGRSPRAFSDRQTDR